MRYIRNIKKRLLLYRLCYILTALFVFLILFKKEYLYFCFVPVILFIRDFIFPIEQVTINQKELTIDRWFMGGTIKTKRLFRVDKIISIANIDPGAPGDIFIDPETGGTLISSGNNSTKEFQRYSLTYFDKLNCLTESKLNLSDYEARLMTT